MKTIFIFLFLLLVSFEKTFAQISDADEITQSKQRLEALETLENSSVNDTLQMFYLDRICRNYSLKSRIFADLGLVYTEKLYQKALSTRNDAKQLRALFYFSNFYLKKNLYTKALEINLTALKKCEETSVVCDEIWRINFRFGQIYYAIKEYDKTVSYIKKAIDYLEAKPRLRPDLHLQLAECYRICGISYQIMLKKEEAKNMFLLMIKHCELAENDVQI